jgi:hypothetical protein
LKNHLKLFSTLKLHSGFDLQIVAGIVHLKNTKLDPYEIREHLLVEGPIETH